jgi:zinc D-Ala-D-Ala carboxypeptidase|tara:strand:- start:208 stop:675 length:468 start_codon:yes stop_codon:yes gene_type:complete
MISKHISDKEATKSITALRLGIDNTPNGTAYNNMKTLAANVFEPLREWVGGPIKITSMYRSPELCDALGSNGRTSQHTKGQAIDIDDIYGHKTNAEMFEYIKNNLEFDQLIWEFGNEDNPDWLHISYVDLEKNRKRILKAVRDQGKVKYINITNV